ncbi:hypothetical protein D3C87_1820840 [compost metagenome]
MNFYCKCSSFITTISQTHSRQHIAFCGNANPCSSSLFSLGLDIYPQIHFCAFNFISFRIFSYLFKNRIYLFKFQIYNIIHNALSSMNMLFKQIPIELRFGSERLIYIREQINSQQSA